jgi:hypothetical protein
MIIFVWVGLRSSFLLISSSPEISAPLTLNAETILPFQRAIPDKQPMPQTAMIRRTIVPIKTGLQVPAIALPALKSLSQSASLAQKSEAPFPLHLPDAPKPAPPSRLPRLSETEATSYQTPRRHFPDPMISAWAIVRPSGSGPILATNGQLGASQTGFRIQQPVLRGGEDGAIALNLRVSAPIGQKLGGEAGLGLSVQPAKRIPIALIFERRIALDDGGRNALAVIAAGGFDDKRLIKKTSMSGYAQAGVVGFVRKDGFIDGSLRLEQAVLERGRTAFRAGAGVWAAAQPGVERIDAGPIVAVKHRLGSASLRISAEYRWRIGGEARPASGPALTIGADF